MCIIGPATYDPPPHLIHRGGAHGACRETLWYDIHMTKKLKELLDRAQDWPEAAQEELFAAAQEIEAGQGEYNATPEELEGIDKGVRTADAGRFATRAEMEALFGEFLA